MDVIAQTQHLMDIAKPWIDHYGLWVLAAAAFAQAIPFIGNIVPGLAINLTAGFLSGAGAFSFAEAIGVSWAAFFCGIVMVFLLGRAIGGGERRRIARRVSGALEDDPWLLYYYFFAEPLRVLIPYIAGTLEYPAGTWLRKNVLGSLAYILFQIGIGYVFFIALASGQHLIYFGLLLIGIGLAITATVRLSHNIFFSQG